MGSLLILTSPEPEEDLYMYLVVLDIAVSVAFFKETDGKQKPVFYTSRMLTDPKIRYNVMEKLILVQVNAKKKLKPYFEAHIIVVLTEHPLLQILLKPNCACRPCLVRHAHAPTMLGVHQARTCCLCASHTYLSCALALATTLIKPFNHAHRPCHLPCMRAALSAHCCPFVVGLARAYAPPACTRAMPCCVPPALSLHY